jgi:hypothetical protein
LQCKGLQPEGEWYVIRIWLSETEKKMLDGLAERIGTSRHARKPSIGKALAQMVRLGFTCIMYHRSDPEEGQPLRRRRGISKALAKRQGLSVVSEDDIRKPNIRSQVNGGAFRWDEDDEDLPGNNTRL